eukprot:TRINITY_DN3520_c0_g1_i1.p1 TRINITY_DN3520_c0_g1~~TRINITY_DN3520_c0_g1_i1.p1  ORF type:complete len:580 (+),score=151.91 TRINITY_DN3520_c0_g1_i1:114-1853(+)
MAHPPRLQGGVKSMTLSPSSPERERGRRPKAAAVGEGTVVDEAYVIKKRIGGGAFSTCWAGEALRPRGRQLAEVCLKVEDAATLRSRPRLCDEFEILSALAQAFEAGGRRKIVPSPLHFAQLCPGVSVMVMELMGPSLGDRAASCGGQFSTATAAHVGVQMLACLEAVHRAGFIHRDVKPQNFLTGAGAAGHEVLIADFGLAKLRPAGAAPTVNHRPAGTIRYVSLNAHRGVEQARRDDLEAVGYVVLHFMLGKLPWQGAGSPSADRHQRHEAIHRYKEQHTLREVCRGAPPEVEQYLAQCRAMRWEEEPDYPALAAHFRAAFDRETNGASPRRFRPDWCGNSPAARRPSALPLSPKSFASSVTIRRPMTAGSHSPETSLSRSSRVASPLQQPRAGGYADSPRRTSSPRGASPRRDSSPQKSGAALPSNPQFSIGAPVDALFGGAYHPGQVYRHDPHNNTYVIRWADSTYSANVVPSHVHARAPAPADARHQPPASAPPPPPPAAGAGVGPGAWVRARYHGELYKAYIHAHCAQSDTYTLCWDDGSHSVGVRRSDIFPVGPSPLSAHLTSPHPVGPSPL